MAATTNTHQPTCANCGEEFTPTITTPYAYKTEAETHLAPSACPAGGGAGHQAARPHLKAAQR